MKGSTKVACLGEVMVEIVPQNDTSALLNFAGDTYNTAVYLSFLTSRNNVEIDYVTALGSDHFSGKIIEKLNGYGISTRNIERRNEKLPGLYAIQTDSAGERSFTYWRSQSAARTLFEEPCDVKPDVIGKFDLIYLSGISMAILPPDRRDLIVEVLKDFRRSGGRVMFDSNYRPSLWEDIRAAKNITSKMWAITDIALPSLDDEMALFGEKSEQAVIERIQLAGPKLGALKRGALGPVSIDHCKMELENFEPVSHIVDSTAAGDSFNAGFLSKILVGAQSCEAMKCGHEIASMVVGHRGAILDPDSLKLK